jgi:exodeoxyribonuclease V alpha subunit
MKVYRGNAAAARNYVEADRSRADDYYYLAEGTGLATRLVATRDGVREEAPMDGRTYEQWVAGYDVETGNAKGRLRTDEQAVRFVEVTVNGPKTWSLAAALHPRIAAAYDAAQDRAAEQIVGWLAQHATTRVGPRGRQVQVPVEEIEAAVVRHFTSRAGDPHRRLHLQINARVLVSTGPTNEMVWRGLHTIGVRDSLDGINGIGHAVVMTDPGFRAALAVHGYTLDRESAEVIELAGYAGAFSARARQIEQNIDRYEAEWRADNPDEEPGPALRRAWDRRAWADARPDKVVPFTGPELAARWVDVLSELGFRPPTTPAPLDTVRTGTLDREALVATAMTRLGARRSAWNMADSRGEVERLITAAGVIVDRAVRQELAEDLAARVVAASVPLLDRDDVPEHVRALTSPQVLAVERELVARLAVEESPTIAPPRHLAGHVEGLDHEQRAAVALLAGFGPIAILEGAAGAGKTATLAATRAVLVRTGRGMVVVTPTRKAAHVVGRQVGAGAHSAAWLLHQHGYRWDEDGRWSRVAADPVPAARLARGDILVVDEAGMLDQDTAGALFELAEGADARVALVGDRHQLPAVGRGGVLDLAARYAPGWCLSLEGVRRFTDPAYADLSLRMRRGEEPGAVFDELPRTWSRRRARLRDRTDSRTRLRGIDAGRPAGRRRHP